MSSAAGRTLTLMVLVVAAAVFVLLRLEVTTDISDFLPTGTDREKARISQAFARGEASRTLVATIEARSAEEAVAVSKAFEDEVRNDADLWARLSFFEAGPPADVDRALWEVYHPRRFYFAAVDVSSARALVSDEGLERAAQALHRRLASPMSTLISQIAPEDPLLSTVRLLERLQTARTDRLATIDGRFVADERFAVFVIGTRASAFDAPEQRVVAEGLEAAYARVGAQMEVGALETSGLARFSIRAEETIKADITRTTTLSIVGLFLLCLLLLRSFRLPVVALVPIGCGLVVATAVSLLAHGRVHGLTFAFGASLIGVCVDYVVHAYVHHVMHPAAEGPHESVRRIWPALVMGGGTTAVGFAMIAGSSFPGLRQVAIFASVGVVTALVATRVFVPWLLPSEPAPTRAHVRLGHVLWVAFRGLRRNRNAGWGLVTVAAVTTIWGVLDIRWEDDLARTTRLDPAMVDEDERVRARVARFDQGRFVVALGDTDEDALQVAETVAEALADARAAGEIGAWQGISTMLPSARRQLAVDEVLRTAPRLRQRMSRVLADAGFNEALFAPFFEAIERPPPPPLAYRDLAESAVAPLVRSMRIEVDGRVAFVTLLRDVHDPEAVAARVERIEGAQYVDQPAAMAAAMRAYRERAVALLGAGLVAIGVVLAIRYRSPRMIAATMTPAILATGVTIAVLAALGRPLDLIGLTAILMISAIGVDYAVFLAESREDSEGEMSTTLVALVVCWLTTVLGFGVLALSEHPTMSMIGLVAAVGVTASLLLAPTTLALLPADVRQRGASSG